MDQQPGAEQLIQKKYKYSRSSTTTAGMQAGHAARSARWLSKSVGRSVERTNNQPRSSGEKTLGHFQFLSKNESTAAE